MRSEFVTFKALVEQNLPKIHRKLKLLGMSIEMLVYKPITSMYATYFSSELTLRLWDLIFLSFSTSI
jgi:Rab-GTPase-TBC domain